MINLSRTAAVGVLSLSSLAMPARSDASMILNNPKVNDFSSPAVIGNSGPSDYTFLATTVKNTTGEAANLRFTMPVSLLDQDGNPATG